MKSFLWIGTDYCTSTNTLSVDQKFVKYNNVNVINGLLKVWSPKSEDLEETIMGIIKQFTEFLKIRWLLTMGQKKVSEIYTGFQAKVKI